MTARDIKPKFTLVLAGRQTEPYVSPDFNPLGAEIVSKEKKENETVTVFETKSPHLRVTIRQEYFDGTGAVKQTGTVENLSDEDVILENFSSFVLDGIGKGELLPFDAPRKFTLHRCHSSWCGEGQWRQTDLLSAGLYPSSVHPLQKVIVTESVGSRSTSEFYPLMILENHETNTVYYFEMEGGQSWHMQLGCVLGVDSAALYAEGDGLFSANGGAMLTLVPGASFTSAAGVYGVTEGGFEDAVRELTVYKRRTMRRHFYRDRMPVVFNDWMDCLWGNCGETITKAQIDAAAAAGVDIFTLDSGWQRLGTSEINSPGDWIPNDKKFGPGGLQGIFDYIREKGMLPGVWMELESVSLASDAYARFEKDGVLRRRGQVIGNGNAFLDFRVPAVCEFLSEKIDMLYRMGVRFIKNDYNQSVGVNCDDHDGSGLGITEHMRAYLDFIDSIYEKYPDLIIESCSGGGMRADNGTVRNFDLQNTSDQEDYFRYPSVLSGILALMPPEKAGIWSYPYPVAFVKQEIDYDITINAAYKKARRDGEETIFNMVNGLCGALYLSGHIERCDSVNFALVREGVSVFKKYRDHMKNAYPVFPLGMHSLNETCFHAQGLLSPDGETMTLAVWRIRAEEDTVRIDLSKYFGGRHDLQAEMIYPSKDKAAAYAVRGGVLTLRLPKTLSARYFKITLPNSI